MLSLALFLAAFGSLPTRYQVAVGWGAGGEGGIVSGYLASVRGGDAFSRLQPGEFLERGTHEDARGVVAAGHRRQLVRVGGVLDAPSRELAALLLERRAQRGLFAWLAAAGSQLAKLTKRRLTFSSLCNRWSLSRV